MRNLGLLVGACAAAAVMATSAAAFPLITNGGFETGDFTGWIKGEVSYPEYIVSGPVHSGSNAAQIAGYLAAPNTLSQTVTTQAGASYVLSFWRFQDYGVPPIGLSVTWNGASVFSETDPGGQPYQKFTANVVGTGSDSLVFTSYNDASYTYLDDVALSGAPEPATWGLMIVGFGGLGAILRRRRAAPTLAL